MTAGRFANLKPADIRRAAAECERLGESEFLAAHGYGRSTRYRVIVGGKLYPSKAILGVAAGLTSREFSGGAAHTVRVLERLGFTVRDGKRRGLSGALAALVAGALSAWPFPALAAPELPVEPVATFASGSNNAGEIRGFAAAGRDVGVAAPRVNAETESALLELAGSDVAVFVDSGAFSEIAFTDAGPKVVEPITDAEWRKRLGLYKRLARALGGQLHVVAPDMVGNQRVTLGRLARYAADIREIAELGAHVLVPAQLGELSQADFVRRANAIVGVEMIPAMPCKKAATSVGELEAFVADYRPTQMHCLGLGARGSRTRAYLAAVAAHVPDCQVTLDSCLIRAHCNSDRRIGVARKIALELRSWASVAERKCFEIALAFGGAA